MSVNVVDYEIGPGADLTSADLRNADLRGADLRGADLTDADLNGANLTRANLTDATLTDANLTRANLTRANLTNAALVRADLTDTNLTDAGLLGVDLTGATLTGANLTRATLDSVYLDDVSLNDADLTDAHLSRANLTRAILTGAIITRANLTGANLTGVNLRDAFLRDAFLTHADLTRADLTHADLTNADLTDAILTDAILTDAQPQQPQQYEQARKATIEQYANNPCKYKNKVPPYLEEPIKRMEAFCLEQLSRMEDSLLLSYFRGRERFMIGGTEIKNITWKTSDGQTQMPEFFFLELAKYELTSKPFNIKLFDSQGRQSAALDYGGVTRMVFMKAGEYINSVLENTGDRLYFRAADKTPLPKDFGTKLTHVIKLSLMQGVVLGIPLSYGLLYFMQKGPQKIKDMKLHILMDLYRRDNPTEFTRVLTYLEDDNFPSSMQASEQRPEMGYLQRKHNEFTMAKIEEDRLEWLKRYLYGELYGSLDPENRGFFQGSKSPSWDPIIPFLLQTCSLEELSEIMGHAVTLEKMLYIIENALYQDGTIEQLATMKKYLTGYFNDPDTTAEEQVEKMVKFLKFGTGAVNPNVRMIFRFVPRSQLPGAHTCANTVDFSVSSYKKFKEHLDVAIQSDDFSVL